jgi:hypothetical protein
VNAAAALYVDEIYASQLTSRLGRGEIRCARLVICTETRSGPGLPRRASVVPPQFFVPQICCTFASRRGGMLRIHASMDSPSNSVTCPADLTFFPVNELLVRLLAGRDRPALSSTLHLSPGLMRIRRPLISSNGIRQRSTVQRLTVVRRCYFDRENKCRRVPDAWPLLGMATCTRRMRSGSSTVLDSLYRIAGGIADPSVAVGLARMLQRRLISSCGTLVTTARCARSG